jgi:iron(III) transport system ATP-binding protein
MIVVTRVTKYFGEVKAVDGISFEVPSDGSLAILGPSGSGKTTLLRLIAGLEVPDEGEIHIHGSLASKPGWVLPPHQRGIGFVFQRPALWPHMTVAQNILFGIKGMPKREARRRLHEMMAPMELTHLKKRYPDQISSGEARRVSIARALAPQSKCVLMDEPFTNLDDELKMKTRNHVASMIQQVPTCLIYVTHDINETNIRDHVLVLSAGRIVRDSACRMKW